MFWIQTYLLFFMQMSHDNLLRIMDFVVKLELKVRLSVCCMRSTTCNWVLFMSKCMSAQNWNEKREKREGGLKKDSKKIIQLLNWMLLQECYSCSCEMLPGEDALRVILTLCLSFKTKKKSHHCPSVGPITSQIWANYFKRRNKIFNVCFNSVFSIKSC